MEQLIMDSQLTMYISIVCVSGVFNIILAMYVFNKRKYIPVANVFIIYTIALAIYSFGNAFGLASSTLDEVMFWSVIQYVGMPFASPLGLIVIMKYLDYKISKPSALALNIVPLITLIMISTNHYHHLYYKSMNTQEGLPVSFVTIEIGQWYIVHGIYTFSCMFIALLLLLARWKQTQKAYRPQVAILICGQLIPIVAAFLYLIGVTPVGLDPVPIVMCVTSALFLWGIMSSNMLVVMPIAKETIFDSMEEGVIVLDSLDRIIDYNKAASGMIPLLQTSAIGMKIDQLNRDFSDMLIRFQHEKESNKDIIMWQNNGALQYYQVRTSPLSNRNGKQAGTLLMFIDISEMKDMQKKLEYQAYYDGLTEIYNRTQYMTLSQQALNEAYRNNHYFSIILFDVDHFKRVNDEHGHAIGDQMLVHIAQIGKKLLSSDIIFARYGGEEFVMSLPSYCLSDAVSIAEQMREALVHTPLNTENGQLQVSASFGVIQASSQKETLDQLLLKADTALYESKHNGRNQVTAYNE